MFLKNFSDISSTFIGSSTSASQNVEAQDICPSGSFYLRATKTTSELGEGNHAVSVDAYFPGNLYFSVKLESNPFKVRREGHCVDGTFVAENDGTMPITKWAHYQTLDLLVTCTTEGFQIHLDGVQVAQFTCAHDPPNKVYPKIERFVVSRPAATITEFSWTTSKIHI